jgi:hypothetical protein
MEHELIGRDIANFVKAGNALFTIQNEATGNRFTYKVRVADDKPELFFVSVCSGPNNTEDYTYLGSIIHGTFKATRGTKVSISAQSFKAFAWFNERINTGCIFPETVHVYHAGRCGRCGRTLTVPESIQNGLGPECIKYI